MLLSPSRFCVCSVVAALTLIVCNTGPVTASDAARRAYGNGVHLLNQGRLTEAIESFDRAAAEIEDPRIYYFRGLAKRRLGRAEGAQSDFQIGAWLEASSGRQNVGRSLERIQGGDRLTIERHRRDARRIAKSMPRSDAPRVVRSESLPEPRSKPPRSKPPRSKPPVRNLAISEVPTDLPPDDRDPFASTATGLLGRGAIEKASLTTPAEPASTEVATDTDDQPLGSGFDEDSLADEPFPAEFADDSEFGSDEGFGSPPSTTKKRGMLGSVFRAVTKSALPATAEQGKSLLDGLRGTIPLPGGPPPAGQPGEPTDGDFTGGDAPMDEQDPFAEPAEPFNDEPADDDSNSDPFNDSADPPEDEADPFSDSADPFSDEGDPFADDQ